MLTLMLETTLEANAYLGYTALQKVWASLNFQSVALVY